MSLDIGRIGPSVVVDNPDAEVDIVLVHGLNGHPENTWTASNKNKTFWPTALLPESLQAVKARVIVYGYNADVYAFSRDAHATTDKIHEHAQSLLNNLQAYREDIGAQRRPIIWVAHSLGGILVKRTLNYSVSLTDPRLESSRDIYVATYGIIFLGTPHNGADKAKWGSILSSIGKAVFNKTGIVENSNNLIETLTSNSEVLQNINLDFNQLTSRFRMTLYHEEDPMPLIGIVVDQVSAGTLIPGCDYGGIAATHTGMTKFEKKGSPGYIPVSGKIRKYGQEAPDLIKQRWVVEDKARVQRRKDFANELDPTRETIPPPAPVSNNTENANTNGKGALQQLGAPAKHLAIEENPHTPPNESDQLDQSNPNLSVSVAQTVSDIPPSDPMRLEPVFIKPSSFNETSTAHFYGMQRTLDDLDERIFDTSTRSSGTAVVLLWCHPGGGKSYVAQQYIYKNLDKFPGGVYWIPAKSKEEIIAGLWAVAEEAAMKDLKDPRTIEKESELARFVDAMKEWFEKKQEWLLVFDGVTITENEADQITHFSRYMPSSKNSAIILTSMDRFLEVEQLLFYPMAIRVEPLSEAEAIEMFFSEIKIKASTATEREREKAKKIVLHYNCIPLAILAVSQRIKLTGEPFLSFQVKEHPSDDAIVSAFKETLDSLEDYNHKPARNLMRILCYYGQYIPYEMVCLAITDLSRWDVDVTESSIGNSPSIDHTIIVLRKYALLDRNANLPNSNSREKRLSSVDMLSILGVVQGVFMVSVEKINETHFWLGLAVRTFCKSYEAAHSRITTRSKQGLVSDYRCYEVHGRKLLDHIKRYESRSKDKDKSLEYRRADLRRKLQHISKQIKARTPGSSQESISEFISVFDRQSSGSSIGPETPDRALSVDSTVSILDPDLPHHASPSTIHSASTQGNVHDNRHRRHTEDLYGTEPGDNPPTLLVRKETTKSESHLQMMIQSAHAPLSGSIPDDDLSDAPRDENVAKHRTVVANEQRQTNKKHMMKFFRSKTISAAPVTAVNPVQANAEPTARSPSLGPVTGRSGAEAALTSASRRASSQRLPPLILNVPDSPVSESAISPTFAESPTENLPIKSSRSSTSLHGPSPLSNLLAGLKFGKRSRASSTASERPRPASSPRPFTAQLNRTSSPDLFALDQQEQKQKNTSQPTHEQLLRMGPNNAPPQTIAVTKQTMSNRRPHSPSPLRQAKPAPKVIPQGYVSDMSMSRDPSGASAWTVAGSEPARYPTEASLDFGTPPPLSVGSRFPTSSIDAAQKFSSTGAWADDVSTVSNFGGQTMSRASSGPPGILSENGIIPIVSSPPLRTSPPAMNNTEFALQVPKDPPLLNSSRAAQLQNEFSQGKYRLQLPQTAYQTGAPLVAVSGGNVPRSSHADSAELARRFRNGEFRYGVPPPYPGHDRMPPAPVQWEGERGRGRRRRSVEALGDGRSGPEGGLSLFWERDA